VHKRRLLTAAFRYGKARGVSAVRPGGGGQVILISDWSFCTVVKPEWGTKRTCPKCGTRFYDLEKDDPVTCIECGTAWEPDPVLKSKQPLPFDAPKKEVETEQTNSDLSDDDLDIDEEAEANPDDDVDLGGDDDIGLKTSDDDDEN
jgi:uncharacterized protein (TIGR02300 family)